MLNLVTGKIGSGKSKVIEILQNKGFVCFKCDDYAKELLERPDIFKRIVELFGKKCLTDLGRIDIMFLRNQFLLRTPEFVTYENLIAEEVYKKLVGFNKESEPIFVECAWIKDFVYKALRIPINNVLVVEVDENIRNDRALARGMSTGMLYYTNKIQNWDMKEVHYHLQRTIRVNNSGSVSTLFDQVQLALEECVFGDCEKEAVFQRLYKNSRNFVKPNVRCYLYKNMLGCANCPFPCKNSDKYFDEMMKAQLEKGIKFKHGTVIHEG